MKNKRKIIVLIIISILLGVSLYLIDRLYIPYEELPFEYVGSASGKLQIIATNDAEKWANEEYVYSDYNGYFIITDKKTWDFCEKVCKFTNCDFIPEFKEGQIYICTYGYPLKTFEYTSRKYTSRHQGYYNRATLWTDDYQEGIYFFYTVEKPQNGYLGSMLEEYDEYWPDWY